MNSVRSHAPAPIEAARAHSSALSSDDAGDA
jgi:hypothetical protein